MSQKNQLFSALVVGSLEHPIAEKCVDWGDNFYIGDYNMVIFNLSSLTIKKLIEINGKDKYYLSNIRDQIVEAQEKTDLIVFCIIDKFISDSYNSLDNGKKISNYTWCPIIPIFEENAGKKIPKQNKTLKIRYPNMIKDWEVLLYKHYNNTNYEDGDDWDYSFDIKKVSYLVNNLKRDIAFGLTWSISVHSNYRKGSNKPIIFLPKIEDLSKGINSILEDLVLIEDPEPDWINEIEAPGEKDIKTKVKDKKEQIDKLKREKEELISESKDITKFKKLLYLQGKSLEKIVEEGLFLLNVNLKKLEVDNLEDRVFEYDSFSIPFEIRGKDNNELNEKDLSQLIKRIADRDKGEKYKTRGVFVINHFRNLRPSERGNVCHSNIIKQAETFNICIISTIEIFNLVNEVLSGEKIELKDCLFNTAGLFNSESIIKRENQK